MSTNIGEGFAFFRWVKVARSLLGNEARIAYNRELLRDWKESPRQYGYKPYRLEKDL